MTKSRGIKKSAAYLDGKIGASGRFQKGFLPWNKGIKFDSGGRSHETRFKPGNRGGKAVELYQPIGAERISKDGYLQRKVNDDMPRQKRWRGVHILVWEEANGPLPAGHAVTFRDGNKQHIALENLELLTRAKAEVDFIKVAGGKGTGFVPVPETPPALPKGTTSPRPGVLVHKPEG